MKLLKELFKLICLSLVYFKPLNFLGAAQLNKALDIGDFRRKIYNTITTDEGCKEKNKKP